MTVARFGNRAGGIGLLFPEPGHRELKNVRIDFLGSDDFSREAKAKAARDLNGVLSGGWPGFVVEKRFPLDAIAEAHE